MESSGQTRSERRAAARAERDRAAAARARQRQRLWILGGVLVLAAVVVAIVAIAAGGGDSTDKPSLKAGESLPGQAEANARFAGIPQRGITLGDPKAPVTMVEFADLQCPYCREYTEKVMPTLVADYVRSGKLKMVFRNVVIIDQDSHLAAEMAAAAGLQNKLWEYVDVFYANQGEEHSGYITDAFLERIGRAVRGLDVDKAMTDRKLPKIQTQIAQAQAEMQLNGFQGTPSFLVGPTGGRLEALSFDLFAPDQFTDDIDAALQRSGAS
ncbi:MAG TPA: thioredoxin domain-containing protein [Conexibacter sp.]|nr:thioredoxin domain-containing protein [Conexibacter sp.]